MTPTSRNQQTWLILGGCALILAVTLFPIALATKARLQTKDLTFYHVQNSVAVTTGNVAQVCTSKVALPWSWNSSRNLEETIRRILLPDFRLILAPSQTLVSLQSFHLSKEGLAIIDLSKEFHTLTATEEVPLIALLLTTLAKNFPKLDRVFITIDGISLDFSKSEIYYGAAFNLVDFPENLSSPLQHWLRTSINPPLTVFGKPGSLFDLSACPTYT